MTRLTGWVAALSWPRRCLLVFVAWAVGSSLSHGDTAGAMVALVVGVVLLVPRASVSNIRRPAFRRASSVFVGPQSRFAGMASARGDERSDVSTQCERPRPATGKAVAE